MQAFRHAVPVLLGLVLGATSAVAEAGSSSRRDAGDEAAQWYVRAEVSVRDPLDGSVSRADNAAVFGVLAASSDTYDRHDIPAYASTAGARIAGVFVHDDWSEHAGEYHSDYRSGPTRRAAWPFTVNSSVNGAVVTVSWDGLYEVTTAPEGSASSYEARLDADSRTLRRLKLVDLTTGEIIPAYRKGGLNTYSFTLADGERSRQLLWVLGAVKGSYLEASNRAAAYMQRQVEVQANSKAVERRSSKAHPVFGYPPVN
ncbi:hypothetical protein E4634_12545 [Mangrovimicrobium sediminis]|uniref:Uncharacterized protein n=1 Tax=Mangrovimicrobium sediminis TaxID=2562682 RepID=A0A4Z0M0B2_9GAMM|nr:hypothetical protein [Haliea sp. SAOS-164]TGD73103.1 hypothetical protein E4634_12545 [Haliea sp. SAOS-164]